MQANYRRIISFCIALGLFNVTVTAHSWGQDISLRDDFESETLSPIWTTQKLANSALRHISSPTRTDHGAIEISVFPGAQTETGGDGQLTERAELREAPDVRLRMGMESWYAFSFFLPSDFPIVETRLVIASWKQSFKKPSKDRSPIVSLRYMGGELRVDVARDRGKRTVFKEKNRSPGSMGGYDFSYNAKSEQKNTKKFQRWHFAGLEKR